LTGSTPFEVGEILKKGLDEIRRVNRVIAVYEQDVESVLEARVGIGRLKRRFSVKNARK